MDGIIALAYAKKLYDLKEGPKGDPGDVSTEQMNAAIEAATTDLKSEIGFVLKENNGFVSSQGKWTNINGTNKHIIVPIKTNDLVTIKASSVLCYYAVLKSYVTPVSGVALDFADTMPSRVSVSANGSASIKVPSDANYLLVTTMNNGTSSMPLSIVVNDRYDYIASVIKNVENSYITAEKSLNDAVEKLSLYGVNNNLLLLNGINVGQRYNSVGSITSGVYYAATNKFQASAAATLEDFLPSTQNTTLERKVTFDSSGNVISVVEANDPSAYKIAKGEIFAFSFIGRLKDGVRYEITSEDVIINEHSLAYDESENRMRWIAFGDSITQGVYSYIDEDDEPASHTDNKASWVEVVKNLNEYVATNNAIGGSGWVIKGTNVIKNIRDLIDSKTGGVYDIDFTDYDLVTIMLGVNDWKGSADFGTFNDDLTIGGTVYSNMRYVIEEILNRNPNIRIIILSPINSAFSISSNPSTADNNWGIGYEVNGKTLENIFQLEKAVCEYYGIMFIDMLHKSCVNRLNINDALPDKVHPSLTTYKQLGKQIAKLI